MTEQLADITARINGVRQLGTVVNAMKGIAAARAHLARSQVDAVDSYAAIIAAALACALKLDYKSPLKSIPDNSKIGLLVFCAEQGFAGAFSERVLDSIGANLDPDNLFLVGTRGLSVASLRGIVPIWNAVLPSHTSGIPKLANAITTAIYEKVSEGKIARLDVHFTGWLSGRRKILEQTLFPIDLSDLPSANGDLPIMQLPDASLIDSLGKDYFHAQICKASLHAFASENEARMEAMNSAGSQIASELKLFEATLNRVRQEAITAEIIELGTAVAAESYW